MDDMCVASADASDERLLLRYHAAFSSHAHYEKPKFAGTQFVLKHYAGDVTCTRLAMHCRTPTIMKHQHELQFFTKTKMQPLFHETFPRK